MAQRVAAVLTANNEFVYLLGFGTYAGVEVPPSEVIGADHISLRRKGQEDIKIVLDSGEVVWGVEAHLVEEDSFLEILKNRRVIRTSITHLRSLLKESPQAIAKWEANQRANRARFN